MRLSNFANRCPSHLESCLSSLGLPRNALAPQSSLTQAALNYAATQAYHSTQRHGVNSSRTSLKSLVPVFSFRVSPQRFGSSSSKKSSRFFSGSGSAERASLGIIRTVWTPRPLSQSRKADARLHLNHCVQGFYNRLLPATPPPPAAMAAASPAAPNADLQTLIQATRDGTLGPATCRRSFVPSKRHSNNASSSNASPGDSAWGKHGRTR